VAFPYGSQIDEPNTVGESIQQLNRDVQRQLGLAAPTRSGERDQAPRNP
jgi:hypothetical protein